MRIKYKILDLEKEIRCEKKGIYFLNKTSDLEN
jgi:hypothetical protein